MEQLYPTRRLTWQEAAKLAQKRVEAVSYTHLTLPTNSLV